MLETGDGSESDIQEDIEFALIQMKAETLTKIDEALTRLDEGAYGYCYECGEEIAERRLRALPFAVRCKDCEAAREVGPASRADDGAPHALLALLRSARADPASCLGGPRRTGPAARLFPIPTTMHGEAVAPAPETALPRGRR